jgi:hypothetical protein
VSQPADSGNRLGAIVSIAGIRLPLQFKQISSGWPISAISHSGKPVAATNYRFGFHWEMREDYHWIEWAFRYQFFAAGAALNWISHIFWLKPLKLVLCNLKSKFTFKNKMSVVQCERKTFQLIPLSTDTAFDHC